MIERRSAALLPVIVVAGDDDQTPRVMVALAGVKSVVISMSIADVVQLLAGVLPHVIIVVSPDTVPLALFTALSAVASRATRTHRAAVFGDRRADCGDRRRAPAGHADGCSDGAARLADCAPDCRWLSCGDASDE